ncbi:MAG: purine-nucleoside phosphorylase [Ruminococcus sp.]|nr:purine-nucleoside phosphorylase [Ruminococcus sp.]
MINSDSFKTLRSCADFVKARISVVPKAAVVLGSGLGAFADEIDVTEIVDYNEIPGFPTSTVEGHKGRFVFGHVGRTPVVIMQGRVHFYEGYPMEKVVLPVRLMRLLGAEILFLTNASGGIDPAFSAGDLMLIEDHISSFVPNPLIGQNIDELGTRFPDMSHVYDPKLKAVVESAARDNGIDLKHGVYVQLTGPSFESPAEIRMLRTLGISAVGMSTVCEAIAANHMGMKICAVSCVANLAAGMTENPLTHAEVQEAADRTAPRFKALMRTSIERFADI